jgi:4-hydroxybenzoate polyprenyltransferase
MLLSQLAIGWTNDYVDRGSDALHQPAKPVPSGLVPAGRLPWAIVLVLLASLAAGGVLGLVPLLCLAIGTAAGLAYDLVFKDTRLSWLPFVVAFAVLPPFVWSALDVFRDEFLWLYPIALPLTIAVHVANTLPDLKSDTAAGRGSIAVALGRRRALWLLTVLMATPVALLGLTLAWVQYDEASLATILAFYAPPLTYAGIAYRRGDRENEVWAFRCVAIAAVLFSGGWLAAV